MLSLNIIESSAQDNIVSILPGVCILKWKWIRFLKPFVKELLPKKNKKHFVCRDYGIDILWNFYFLSECIISLI